MALDVGSKSDDLACSRVQVLAKGMKYATGLLHDGRQPLALR